MVKLLPLPLGFFFLFLTAIFISISAVISTNDIEISMPQDHQYKNAYVTMMYMGTPRDYEFYMATRVMLRSLTNLKAQADLVVIASMDVPLHWVQTLEREDRAKVVRVENVVNPYMSSDNPSRFKLTLNKLYAWSLVKYDRVVMLDADNLFLRSTDELFQCGQFCATFINPCIFHTGLFVIQPSMKVFNNMLHELETGRENRDGADQGFLVSYFPDLLDKPLFHPPPNGTKLEGQYRLPLGYQMDASYFYLKLKWHIPCGPNSVVTFPSASWLKPWYWWSWPVLPLGISWHEVRRQTIGYGAEISEVIFMSLMYLAVMAFNRLACPNLSKFCYRYQEKSGNLSRALIKLIAMWSVLAVYMVPFFFIPSTIHPIVGWILYFMGIWTLGSVVSSAFLLPALHVMMLGLGMFGSLLVMAYPWYNNGVTRALVVFLYAFCCSPVAWSSLMKVHASLQNHLEKEAIFVKLGEVPEIPVFNKIC